MIHIEGLTYRYPATSEPALQEVSLEVPEGQFLALVGANGAGKSTLCYALTGFIPHFFRGHLEGVVEVAGHDLRRKTPADLAGEVGLVFQDPFNQITGARFTVREEVAFGPENLGLSRAEVEARVEEALALTGLTDLADRSPVALSGGQQQRVAIASILAMRPRVLVLDEPTSQLDPMGTREVFATLHRLTQERRATIVLAEHKLEWVAAFADRVVALAGGRVLADGPPRQVLTEEAVARAGVGRTRYTEAAAAARRAGLARPEGPLPVTLEQAVEFFR